MYVTFSSFHHTPVCKRVRPLYFYILPSPLIHRHPEQAQETADSTHTWELIQNIKKKLFSAWAIPCWHFSLHLSLGLIQWARMCDFFQWLDLLMLKSLKGRLMASFIPTPVYSFYTWTLRRQLACLTVMVGKIPDTRKARTQFQHIHHTHTHTRVTFSSGWKLTSSCFSRSV